MSVPEITQLLDRLKSETGDSRKQVYDELVTILYGELKRRARKQLAGERAPSFQPTLLVHEAYQRMLSYSMPFEDREHFLNVAATAMRRVLIERARKLHAAKREAQRTDEDLDQMDAAGLLEASPERLIDLDRAIDTLRPEQVRLTELRFFAGFTLDETAEIMKLQPETAKKRWKVIKTLLFDRLDGMRKEGTEGAQAARKARAASTD